MQLTVGKVDHSFINNGEVPRFADDKLIIVWASHFIEVTHIFVGKKALCSSSVHTYLHMEQEREL